jgi:protein-disulfide isomerase
MRYDWGLIAGAMLIVLAGCQDQNGLREIRDGQRELRVKLEEMEKKIDQIAARPAAAPAAQRPNQPDPNKIYNLPVGNSPMRGPKNAPVTLVEFADFQCPFCARNLPLVKQVLDAYPNDVNFVYKEFPLTSIHNNAMNASKAAIAAQKQGKYWEMHDKLFENFQNLGEDSLKKYAGEVGLDVAQWEKDYKSPEVAQQVQDDMRLASQSDVRGTPTMFVNGKRVANRSFEGIKEMIDTALKEKAGAAKAG